MSYKIKNYLSLRRFLSLATLLALALISLRVDVALSQAVTQGYASDEPLQRGMVVRIDEEDTTKVAPVTQATSEGTYGVVVDANDAPATLSTDSQQVFVATAGKYDVLVSNQNGAIKPGDYIVISSVSGIGMKVDQIQPIVVARALEGFDGTGDSIGSAQVGETTVNFGRILADVNISGNPLQRPPAQRLPEALRRIAEDIAQKPVSLTRLYISLAILIVSAIVSGSLLYSGVRSAITSIGRNPLSKKSILRGMFQVIIVGLIIFIVGIFGVYLLLKL